MWSKQWETINSQIIQKFSSVPWFRSTLLCLAGTRWPWIRRANNFSLLTVWLQRMKYLSEIVHTFINFTLQNKIFLSTSEKLWTRSMIDRLIDMTTCNRAIAKMSSNQFVSCNSICKNNLKLWSLYFHLRYDLRSSHSLNWIAKF